MQLFQCAFYLNQSTWYLLSVGKCWQQSLKAQLQLQLFSTTRAFFPQNTVYAVDVITSY